MTLTFEPSLTGKIELRIFTLKHEYLTSWTVEGEAPISSLIISLKDLKYVPLAVLFPLAILSLVLKKKPALFFKSSSLITNSSITYENRAVSPVS